jgi:RNA polymerase sigma-70 factor (ECF subfamily)
MYIVRTLIDMPPLQKPTDESLMQEVAHGNLDSLKVLFERHHRHIYSFVYKMSGDRMLSEDITQEVFYKLMKYRATYNNGKFISWLFSIARNSLKSYFLKNRGVYVGLDSVQHQVPEDESREKTDYSDLQLALNRLDASDRELLVLHRLQGRAYGEIADILGSTPGAVKTKACRALKKLRQFYFEDNEK